MTPAVREIVVRYPDGSEVRGFAQHVDPNRPSLTICKFEAPRHESGLVEVNLPRVASADVILTDGTSRTFT